MKQLDVGLTDDKSLLDMILGDIPFEDIQMEKIEAQMKEDGEWLEERCQSNSKWNVIKTPYALIQEFNGFLLYRVVIIRAKIDKRKKVPLSTDWMEVYRSVEGYKYAVWRNCYINTFCGYDLRPTFNDEKIHKYWHMSEYDRDRWQMCCLENLERFIGDRCRLYTVDDLLSLRPELKYSQVKLCNHPVFYLAYYRAYPEVEMLKKCKFTRLYNSTRCLNRLKKGDKAFMKFLFKCYQEKNVDRSYEEYIAFYKRYGDDSVHWNDNWKKFDFVNNEKYRALSTKSQQRYYYNKADTSILYYQAFSKVEQIEELYGYLTRKGYDITRYRDYFQMAVRVGHDMEDPYWRYPNDLNKAHDKVMEELKNVQDMNVQMKGDYLKEVVKDLKNYDAVIDGYQIFIPDSLEDIKKQCDTLYQCLIRNNYVTSVLMQDEILAFIWKDGNPVATAQLFYEKNTNDGQEKFGYMVGQFYANETGHKDLQVINGKTYICGELVEKELNDKFNDVYYRRAEFYSLCEDEQYLYDKWIKANCMPEYEAYAAFVKWLETFQPVKRKAERKNHYYKGFHSLDPSDNTYHTSYGNFTFEIGKTYQTHFDDKTIIDAGANGCCATDKVFHFCESISEISKHYCPKFYCEVEPLGPVLDCNGALLTNKLKIVRGLTELEVNALLEIERAAQCSI